MIKAISAWIAALLAAVLLLGTTAQAQQTTGATGSTGSTGASGATGANAAAAAVTEYRLGAGDVVRISVFQNPDLTLETRVTEAGVISYPLLGIVRVGGQSVTETEKRIADGLRNGNLVKSP